MSHRTHEKVFDPLCILNRKSPIRIFYSKYCKGLYCTVDGRGPAFAAAFPPCLSRPSACTFRRLPHTIFRLPSGTHRRAAAHAHNSQDNFRSRRLK